MKKNYKTLFLFLVSYVLMLDAFSQNQLVKQWDYRFGGTNNDRIFSFQQTTDGGYILGGYSFSGISGDKTQTLWGGTGDIDYWIVKIDSLGNKQWDKDFGGTDWDYFFPLQQTVDGGYILGGFSGSGISGDKTQPSWGGYDYWIVKIDSLGNKQWDKDFGGTGDEQFFSLQQTTDGGYILGGVSNSGISGDKTQANWDTIGYTFDYWIVKTDSLGNKQWDKDFGGTHYDYLNSLRQTTDEGYILGGTSYSGINGDKTQNTWGDGDYWIVKTDSLGNKQWDKDLGATNKDELFSLRQTADGGYILGGISNSYISGDKTQISWGFGDYWIVKTDSLGNKQWDKDFGGNLEEDEFGNVSQTTDGGYLIAGTSYSYMSGDKTESNFGQEQAWIIKTDSSGSKQWDKTIFTSGHDEQGLAVQTNDECYAIAVFTNGGIAGYKTQPTWGLYDYWIVKFCDTTLTTSITPITQSPNYPITVSPNPAIDKITITFPNVINKGTIEIYNVLGKKVFSQKPATGSQQQIAIDVSSWNKGIYFVKVTTEEKQYAQKVIIQ